MSKLSHSNDLTMDQLEALRIRKEGLDVTCCGHTSDCAVHNMPAYPNGPCSCGFEERINLIIRDVAELPDRTSPDDWPDAMLVTADELRNILEARLHALAAQPDAGKDQRGPAGREPASPANATGLQTSGPHPTQDAERLESIAENYLHLIPFDIPTGQGDADVGWRVLQSQMGKGDVLIAEIFEDDPCKATDAAIAALRASAGRKA